MRVRARAISAARLRGSRPLHLRPIDQVFCLGPYHKENSSRERLPAYMPSAVIRAGRGYRAMPLVDNPCTGGPSTPVLSYWGQPPSILLRPRRIGTELSHDVLNPARVPL